MSLVNLKEYAEPPEEGSGVLVSFKHPFTDIPYKIALFQVQGTYYALPDQCKKCGGSLSRGALNGLFAFCNNEECGWNLKKGFCKFDRTMVTPTYKVSVEEEGLIINI